MQSTARPRSLWSVVSVQKVSGLSPGMCLGRKFGLFSPQRVFVAGVRIPTPPSSMFYMPLVGYSVPLVVPICSFTTCEMWSLVVLSSLQS